MTALLAPGLARRQAHPLYGAKKLAKTKLAEQTIVIDPGEHVSYDAFAAALSGVRSMHRLSDTAAPAGSHWPRPEERAVGVSGGSGRQPQSLGAAAGRNRKSACRKRRKRPETYRVPDGSAGTLDVAGDWLVRVMAGAEAMDMQRGLGEAGTEGADHLLQALVELLGRRGDLLAPYA